MIRKHGDYLYYNKSKKAINIKNCCYFYFAKNRIIFLFNNEQSGWEFETEEDCSNNFNQLLRILE